MPYPMWMTENWVKEAFWFQVERDDGCWVWKGSLDRWGYGNFRIRNMPLGFLRIAAHRYAWILEHGPIEGSLCALHQCDNRVCVNPAHLFLGTRLDNHNDKMAKGRQVHGERVINAKLAVAQVRQIRDLYFVGWSQADLARKFSVSPANIWHIVGHNTWRAA